MINKIILEFKKYNIKINNIQAEKFLEYYRFLVQENEKFNLTAITNFEEVITKHFVDSSLPYLCFKKNSIVVDVGSGAGFPGLPLKIIRPDLEIVLVDSLNKRVSFLNQIIKLINLDKVYAIHARVEDFAQKNREKFDYAVSRAVAKANTLIEYLLPLVKEGGCALLYKSKNVKEELDEAHNALLQLGGVIKSIERYSLAESERNVVIIKKIKRTPIKFPRGKNLPKNKPIC